MSAKSKPSASLSFDLDNQWSYMKTHGEPGWDAYPSYFSTLIPMVIDWLAEFDQQITFFVVGQDVIREENHGQLRALVAAGHELGNHSLNHEPWMQDYEEDQVMVEVDTTHKAIEQLFGVTPVGFRGPGFCYSATVLEVLVKHGYAFDASTLPSILGPIARLHYFATSSMNRDEKETRNGLFGKFSDGFRSLKPFFWETPSGRILEIPVSTIPVFRVPFHLSYLLWLSRYSRPLALAYFEMALMMCRLRGVEPSFLLHPLDFIGNDDVEGLGFFPGMDLPRAYKLAFARDVIQRFKRQFDVVPMSEHARRIREGNRTSRVISVLGNALT